MRILVIEDEPQVAELIEDALSSAGHECLRAQDAEEAERLLSTGPVDGITLDVRMPGRDGLDWLGTLFEARPELARRTVVITGKALSPLDCNRVARCGASMLAKPFDVDDLIETLSHQLAPTHRIPFSRN